MTVRSTFVWDESFKSAADLSAKQGYLAELTAQDTVNVCGAAADIVLGVIVDGGGPVTGAAVSVRILGMAEVVSDGSGTAIAVGDRVGPNTAGKAVKKATADYSVCGVAMTASSADGTIIQVLLTPMGVFRTLGG